MSAGKNPENMIAVLNGIGKARNKTYEQLSSQNKKRHDFIVPLYSQPFRQYLGSVYVALDSEAYLAAIYLNHWTTVRQTGVRYWLKKRVTIFIFSACLQSKEEGISKLKNSDYRKQPRHCT